MNDQKKIENAIQVLEKRIAVYKKENALVTKEIIEFLQAEIVYYQEMKKVIHNLKKSS